MKIVLLGAPGSGKGTLAQLISKDFNFPQISTGDILRDEISKGTKLGKKINELISNGNFVPDEVIIELLKRRLKKADCKNGYVLDGYPRNISQAEYLQKVIKIDKVFLLDTPLKDIQKRLASRRICEKCKLIYNTKLFKGTKCSECGGNLIVRDDDKPEIIKTRFEIYNAQTKPLIEFYKNNIIRVDGSKSIQEAYAPVKEFLKKKVNNIDCKITY